MLIIVKKNHQYMIFAPLIVEDKSTKTD